MARNAADAAGSARRGFPGTPIPTTLCDRHVQADADARPSPTAPESRLTIIPKCN